MLQLLIELFCEEIPARMQANAARDLERMFADRLKEAGLAADSLKSYAGPRRLTLVAEGLPAAQEDRVEERKGPRANAPEQAMEGFLRSTGLTRDQLTERDGVLYASIARTGRPTPQIVAEALDHIIRNFPWPKSMTWGTGTLRWVRPLKRIVALFDGAVVPFEIEGIKAGDLTEGHRFMGADHAPFAVKDFASYQKSLREHFVILDAAERRSLIAERATALCAAAGLELVDDQGLLDEVSGLAEWPTPILGAMDPGFLDLPGEVIRTSMRTHQKYFAVRDPKTGKLAPHFIVVANIEATDGGKAVAAGNSRVLSARLDDARFFWDEDLKAGNFERWLEKLNGVTFHAKLGTMAQRVERITALAREIAPLVGADPDKAAEAARLAKADLASGMVGEFPELQGVMGGYYAVAGKLDPEIADAVRDHYKPQGPGDSVPSAPVTIAVALADKLDTLTGFFAIDEKPTGSRDPFALRRAALGIIRILLDNRARAGLRRLLSGALAAALACESEAVLEAFAAGEPEAQGRIIRGEGSLFAALLAGGMQAAEERTTASADEEAAFFDGQRLMQFEGFCDRFNTQMLAFFQDRLQVTLRDQGKRHDLVGAIFALGDDDLVRIVARVEALDALLKTEDGANLLAGYRRAVNILKAEAKKNPGETYDGSADPQLFALPEETALQSSLTSALAALDPQLQAEDFAGAMSSLAAMRGPVDAFFDKVLVNDPEPAVRLNRLRLLSGIRGAANRVADFSLIGG